MAKELLPKRWKKFWPLALIFALPEIIFWTNPKRLSFLGANQNPLALFFPDLYRSIEIQRELSPDILEAVLQ